MIRARQLAAIIVLGLVVSSLSGCAGRKRAKLESLEALAAAEGYRLGMQRLAERELRQAKATLERIQYPAEGPSRQEIEPLVRLAIADLTYWQGAGLNLIDARSLYLDFVTLNGAHALAPYAQLQAGQCSLRQVNHPSQDQTLTLQAVSDLDAVKRRYPASRYVVAAAQMLLQAQARLAEHEFMIGKFYLKKKAYGAASARLRGILTKYPGFSEPDRVYYFLARAHLSSHEIDEGRRLLDQIVADYPNGRYVELARKALAEPQAPPPPAAPATVPQAAVEPTSGP